MLMSEYTLQMRLLNIGVRYYIQTSLGGSSIHHIKDLILMLMSAYSLQLRLLNIGIRYYIQTSVVSRWFQYLPHKRSHTGAYICVNSTSMVTIYRCMLLYIGFTSWFYYPPHNRSHTDAYVCLLSTTAVTKYRHTLLYIDVSSQQMVLVSTT